MDTDSAYIALADETSMDSSGQIVVRTTSETDPNGFRPNVATNTKMTMSVLEKPVVHGRPQSHAVSHAKPSTS